MAGLLSAKTAKKLYELVWNKENLLPTDPKVLTTIEIAENTQKGTEKNYRENIKNKQTSKISSQEIILDENDPSLQMIFICNTSCLDSSNYQNGILDGSYLNKYKQMINGLDRKNGKIVVYMTNFMGKEWTFSHLVKEIDRIRIEKGLNATSVEDLKKIVRNYYGINKRKQVNMKILSALIKMGVDEIYIMKGNDEFAILKQTGRDICQEIINELNSNQIKYIAEGTETKINIVKKTKGKKNMFATMKLDNNNLTKSAKPSYAEKPEDYYEDRADVTFKCGGNFTAAQKHLNVFYPSSQSTFQNTTKGKNPKFMFNDGNIYQLIVEDNHDVSVIINPKQLFDDNYQLLNKIYHEKKLKKEIINKIKQKLDNKLNKKETIVVE